MRADYPFLLMPVGAAHELWVWLLCGVSDRQIALAVFPAAERSAWLEQTRLEENTARRMLAAFEYFVQNRSAYYSSWVPTWWDGLGSTGVDEIGLALFGRVLTRTLKHWQNERTKTPYKSEVRARLAVLEPLSRLFHERLDRTPEEVQLRAEDLLLDEDPRSSAARELVEYGGYVIQGPADGFLLREEREDRERMVRQCLEKRKAGA